MKTRNAGIELLKIISMSMIVGCHYITFSDMFSTGNIYFAGAVFASSLCCVDAFVLITGWFYGKNSSVNLNDLKKAVFKSTNLWLTTVLYSLLILGVTILGFKQQLTLKLLVKTIIPITSKAYWFLSAYVLLLFVIPFLNCLINSISTKGHFILVLIIIAFISLPSAFLPNNWQFDESEGYSIFWLVCLYIIGAFLRRIYDKIQKSKYVFLLGYFLCVAFTFLYFVVVRILCIKFGISDKSTFIFRYPSLPVLGAAIFLVLFFAEVNIKSNALKKIIISVASVTFDVYIIHTHVLVRFSLFIDLLHTDKYCNSPFLPLHFIASVLLIVLSTTIIGLLKKQIFDKPFRIISEKVSSIVDIIERKFALLSNYEKE